MVLKVGDGAGDLYTRLPTRCNTGRVDSKTASLEANWDQVAQMPLLPVNQAICQLGIPLSVTAGTAPEGICLSMGYASAPLLVGDDEAKQRQLEAMGYTLHVVPGGRFLLSRAFAEQMVDVLTQSLQHYDDAVEAGKKTVEPSNG